MQDRDAAIVVADYLRDPDITKDRVEVGDYK